MSVEVIPFPHVSGAEELSGEAVRLVRVMERMDRNAIGSVLLTVFENLPQFWRQMVLDLAENAA